MPVFSEKMLDCEDEIITTMAESLRFGGRLSLRVSEVLQL